jgi:hypothetical protein
MSDRVDRLPFPHHAPPPSGLAGDGMVGCDILVAGQRMADENDVGAVLVHCAIGFISDIDRRKDRAAVKPERPGEANLAAEAETAVVG